jgi:hypothetical protein
VLSLSKDPDWAIVLSFCKDPLLSFSKGDPDCRDVLSFSKDPGCGGHVVVQ